MAKYELLEERCVQTGNCLELAPSLFAMDDDGIVTTTKDSPEGAEEQAAVKSAARGCPALAIVHGE